MVVAETEFGRTYCTALKADPGLKMRNAGEIAIPTPSDERMAAEIAAGLNLYRGAAARTTR